MTPKFFATSSALRAWLAQHHDNVRAAANALADLHLRCRPQPLGNIQLRPAAELDHADALPALQQVPFARVEDDPPGDQTRRNCRLVG